MLRLPVLLIVSPPSAELIIPALRELSIRFQLATPAEASDAVREGAAELIICERMPGWQALAGRVQGAGGAAVLWGGPITDGDRPELLQSDMLCTLDPRQLPVLLKRAQDRLHQRLTDRRNARNNARPGQVSQAARDFAAQLNLEGLADEVRTKLRQLCDADTCEVWCVDTATGELVTAPGTGAERIRMPAGQGLVGKTASEASPLTAHAEELRQCDDPRLRLHNAPRGAVAAVPLIHRGDVLGVVELIRASDAQAFTERDLEPLIELAPHIAIALHNAHLTQGLRDAQTQALTANADLERRVAERTQQIAQAKREWESTFDAIEDPIAVMNGFTLRRVNMAYSRVTGIPITRLPGRTCYEVLARRTSPCTGCPLAASQARLQGEVMPRDGWYFRFSGFPLPGNAGGSSVVVHYQDVTSQRALEARLRESERLASVGQLASGAAHEINNPLGFVTSNLSSLRATLGDVTAGLEALVPSVSVTHSLKDLLEESQEMIGDALNGAQRVATIVKALRELSRQEIGRLERTRVNASLERAVRAELGEEAARVSLSLASEGLAEIIPLQLDRAVGQLLRNARQAVASPDGIAVRSWDDGDVIHIEVEDKGEGIADEHVHRIFEPFFTTRGVGKGMGLGLTAAYGIVRRVGGSIEVKTKRGEGSTFSILLPRSGSSSAVEDAASAAKAVAAVAGSRA